jgi:putative Mn2+ efflux pump MntP
VLSVLALSFGLAMDATAVCAARALGARDRRELIILPLLFGVFQAGMASLGWLGGRAAVKYIGAWDHWVAFGLLVLIGGKMVIEALRDHDEQMTPGTPLLYLGLAIATSIDAAAAGLTLHMLEVAPWLALVLIGTVTAALCTLGYAAGRALGHKVGPKLGAVGGLVLIGIGIHVLIHAP